jgi:hypothetical protein
LTCASRSRSLASSSLSRGVLAMVGF